jgi:hypothetical protein
MISLTLTRDELAMMEIALKLPQFQGIISAPQTRRASRDAYRGLIEKVRGAIKAEQGGVKIAPIIDLHG